MKEKLLKKVAEVEKQANTEKTLFLEQKGIYEDKINELRKEVEKLLPPIGSVLVSDGKEYKISKYSINPFHPYWSNVYGYKRKINGDWYKVYCELYNLWSRYEGLSTLWELVKK